MTPATGVPRSSGAGSRSPQPGPGQRWAQYLRAGACSCGEWWEGGPGLRAPWGQSSQAAHRGALPYRQPARPLQRNNNRKPSRGEVGQGQLENLKGRRPASLAAGCGSEREAAVRPSCTQLQPRSALDGSLPGQTPWADDTVSGARILQTPHPSPHSLRQGSLAVPSLKGATPLGEQLPRQQRANGLSSPLRVGLDEGQPTMGPLPHSGIPGTRENSRPTAPIL